MYNNEEDVKLGLEQHWVTVHSEVLKNHTMEFEDDANEVNDGNIKFRKRVNDDHSPKRMRHIKRIILSLTKPSYTLGLGLGDVRTENRHRLCHLLRKLVRQHNWEEASGVLSVLLKGTCKEKSPKKNRMKYWVTMELLKHIEIDRINPMKINHVYEIWMKKIGSMKNWPLKDRFVVQLEFILFCLTQGNIEDARQAAICLMQESEFGSDPISNMIVGLTFCQLWYSAIPKEMQLRDSDESYSPMQSEMLGTRFNNTVENSEGRVAVDIHEADFSFRWDSDTSVMKDKDIAVGINVDQQREVSMEVDVNLQRGKPQHHFQSQGFYMNSAENTGHDSMQYASIFYAHGLDSWLLPLQLPHSNENLEDFIYLHREMLNDYYKDAVKYLRLALYSTPPVSEALLPLTQLLLVGDQVKEALNELEKFCSDSNTALPFRLRASLLERFDNNNSVMLSTCFEDILKKDPTCSHSLERLVNMHQNGDYNPEQLLEMIALHLDATYAEYNTWKEFACCFLKLSSYEEDRMSMCLNGNEGGCKPRYSIRFNRIPKIFTQGISGKTWRFRCRWWLTRHFSQNILMSEIAAGDLQLLTYKAACASHIYGREFKYVVEVYTCLEKEKSREMFLFLQMCMQNSIGLYSNFDQKTR